LAFPGTYNFSYYKADTYQFVIRPKNPNGGNFDLAGYTANFFIASSRGNNPTFRVQAQAIVNPTSDIVTCTILPGVGGTLNAGTYVYDVEITSGPTTVYTLLTGNITVTEQVTGAS
jgi:hypothetical protein